MGRETEQEAFDEDAYARFSAKLDEATRALRLVVARAGFGCGDRTIGAELELNLVDALGLPALKNRAILAATADDRVTLEIDRFNLEINARPAPLAGTPFRTLGCELREVLGAVRRAAQGHGADVVMVGILPTLVETDITPEAMTESKRYHALSFGLQRLRAGAPLRFPLHIRGEDALSLSVDDLAAEGANTSFQVHLRTAPEDYADTYNAAQLATAVALAASANSPLFLQRRLWDETRIALFRQSVDERTDVEADDWRPARVSFGHGWVRRGVAELFEEAVRLHGPLLPVLSEEEPLALARAGGVPRLAELRLHNGTVWRWNRPVYDDAEGGHLRVEMRALPAGPTVDDMTANAAFLVGLTLGLAPTMDELVTRVTFGQARRNFYAAAERGLDAELLWPDPSGATRPWSARELGLRLLPLAREGLLSAGVDAADADDRLELFGARLERGVTGARWQRARFQELLEETSDREQAARALLARYRELSDIGAPVHAWPAR